MKDCEFKNTSDLEKLITNNEGNFHFNTPEFSEWKCYLFGAKPGEGITYMPKKGGEPNWFIRWMMKICLGCTWKRDVG